MAKVIKVPVSHLVFKHHEIGCHRGRKFGFREVFGFPTLMNLPFLHLADRVKRAYDGKGAPHHSGWPAQREAIQWLVDQGRDAIYALEEGILVKLTSLGTYYITDGNHRALALYILGDQKIQARLKR
jgi:hypothetical protein